MTSSRRDGPERKILRNTSVKGVVFCSPTGQESAADSHDQEARNLKALEDFWHQKGIQEGQEKGFESGLQEGQENGYQKGLEEGSTSGKEEGYEKGLQEGLAKGRAEATAKLEEKMALAVKLGSELQNYRDQLFEDLKPALLGLSIQVCKRILKQELEKPAVMQKLIEELLGQARSFVHEAPVQVVLSPADLDLLDSRLEEVKFDRHSVTELHFVSDNIPKGNFRIEAAGGLINFNVDRLLNELEKELVTPSNLENS